MVVDDASDVVGVVACEVETDEVEVGVFVVVVPVAPSVVAVVEVVTVETVGAEVVV